MMTSPFGWAISFQTSNVSSVTAQAKQEKMTNPLEGLPEEVIHNIWVFLGAGRYRYVAGVHSSFRDSYTKFCVQSSSRAEKSKVTYPSCIVESLACAKLYVDELNGELPSRSELVRLFRREPEEASYSWQRHDIRCLWVDVAHLAALHGQTEILRHSLNHFSEKERKLTSICELAAMSGHLPTLKLAREQGLEWNYRACNAAAKRNHFEILKWLHENGCEWGHDITAAPCWGGHLDLLKWLHGRGCKLTATAIRIAAAGGHLGMIQWLRDQGSQWHGLTCNSAALGGHLEVLRWVRDKGCPWDQFTGATLAFGGHLETLKWARSTGCPMTKSTCNQAVLGGQPDVFWWAIENDLPRDEKHIGRFAAARGQMEILEWAIQNGCTWSVQISCLAARNGQLDVLKWAKHQQQEAQEFAKTTELDWRIQEWLKVDLWDESTCAAAATGGHLSVIEWLRSNGCPWNEKATSAAAVAGDVKVLKWLHEHGCPWDETTCHSAAKAGHLKILQYARVNGCDWGLDKVTELAAQYPRIVRWISENQWSA